MSYIMKQTGQSVTVCVMCIKLVLEKSYTLFFDCGCLLFFSWLQILYSVIQALSMCTKMSHVIRNEQMKCDSLRYLLSQYII